MDWLDVVFLAYDFVKVVTCIFIFIALAVMMQ